MSSYENSSLTEVEAVLDGLEEATAEDVFDATRPYSPRAIASVAASRADAAGGGGAVQAASATLTHAQILALRTTPVEIVPGPGEGYALDILRVQLVARIVEVGHEYTDLASGAYLSVLIGALGFELGFVSNNTYFGNDLITDLLALSSDTGIGGNTVFAGPFYDVGNPDLGAQPVQELAGNDVDNVGAYLKLNGQAVPLTGGNAQNTLIVRTLYSVVPLS